MEDYEVCPMQLRRIIFTQLNFIAKVVQDKKHNAKAQDAQALFADAAEDWGKIARSCVAPHMGSVPKRRTGSDK